MKQYGAFVRFAVLSGFLICAGAPASPAFAAQADIDLLKSYLGSWKGRGVLTGAESETVVCRLSLSEGNGEKINYSGRCVLAGSNLSIKGTIAYIDASRRYEAVMTSNASFTGVAVGRQQGGGVVFNLQERDTSDGQDMAITAGIALTDGTIKVDFRVVDTKTGRVIKANVPFAQ
jgi:hypothetical protein